MRRRATSTARPARWLGIGVASLVLAAACTGSGAGVPYEYTVDRVVPEDEVEADVGWRING